MSRITTEDGKRIGYLTCDLSEGETAELFKIRVQLGAGLILKATPSDADITIEAALIILMLPLVYVDLVNVGIPLDVYGDGTIDAWVRVTAADPLSGDGLRRIVEYLAVTNNSAAQWAA